MRFRSLQLHRYGLFETRDLDLSGTVGLVVVFGPNEAGKSTLLAAVSDFLFGVHERSPHGQRFGYDQMRITAQIELADGVVRTFRRHKARGARALTDDAGQPAGEAALAAVLGGVGREKFEALFGLNHASLRTGGESLLAADGDIGRLIVEAGGGLRSLMSRLAALDAEASALFATRKNSERAFYKALEAFTAAERVVKDGNLSFDAYRAAGREVETQMAALDAVRVRRARSSQSLLSLQRLVRVAPVIRQLSECNSQLDTFADVRALDRSFPARATKAIDDHQSASLAALAAAEEVARLQRERDGVAIETALIAKETMIRDIGDKPAHVRRERTDRSKREAELQASQSKLASLRRAIHADDSKDLKAVSPEARIVARVQELAAVALEQGPQLAQALRQIEEMRTALTEGERLQVQRAADGVDKPLAIREAEFARLPALTTDIDRKRKDLATRTSRLLADCSAIGATDMQSLRNLLWPDPTAIDQELRGRADIARGIQVATADQKTLASKITKARQTLARTQKEGDLPTPAAISGARETRDGSWTKIRRLFLERNEAAWVEASAEVRGIEVTAFETAKALADNLADRKGDEAQRIAEARRAQADLDDHETEAAALAKTLADLTAQQIAGRAAWIKTWPNAAQHADQLEAFRTLSERRLATLKAADERDERQDQLEAIEAEVEAARQSLASAELQLDLRERDKRTLTQRIADVTGRIAEHHEAHTDYRSTAANLKAQETELKQLETLRKKLEAERKTWDAEWAALMPKIGISAEAGPQLATQVTTAWAAADGVFDAIAQTKRRLDRMDEEERELGDLVTTLGQELEIALPSDAVAAADMLTERWKKAKANAEKHEQLTQQLTANEAQSAKAAATLKAAAQTLDACCDLAGCVVDALPTAIERCTRANSLLDQAELHTKSLNAASDDVALITLEAEINNRSMDALNVAKGEIEAEAAEIDRGHETAVRALQEAERVYASMTIVGAASVAIAEREAAAADLGRIAQRYVELVLVRKMLEAAIERVRKEQQNPLVARAAELFALCTRGEFTGIETDVDEKGAPVVIGLRSDESRVRVSTMSDGTRDQLYLAFRLASVEHYAKAAEPLPFIADDVLVHFDDPRSVATLDLLAEFGRTTQVVLFTHHESVLTAARKLAADGRASVIELA